MQNESLSLLRAEIQLLAGAVAMLNEKIAELEDDQPQPLDIVPGGGARGGFSGRVYLAGVKFDGYGKKKWVRVRLDTNSVEDSDGPPPDPMPPTEEWYEVDRTYGDIHIPRFG